MKSSVIHVFLSLLVSLCISPLIYCNKCLYICVFFLHFFFITKMFPLW